MSDTVAAKEHADCCDSCTYMAKAWRERRCTGRTSRLLRDAIIRAQIGQPVVLVFTTDRMCETMRLQLRSVAHRLGVDKDVAKGIQFVAERKWRKGGVGDGTTVVLVDHSVTGEEE